MVGPAGLALPSILFELMGGKSELKAGWCRSAFWFTCRFAILQTLYLTNADRAGKAISLVSNGHDKSHAGKDNSINQEIGIAMLESLGCMVELAETGTKAIECFGTRPLTLFLWIARCRIWTVMTLPELFAVANGKRINRTRPQEGMYYCADCKCSYGDKEKCLAAGMDDYLAKRSRYNRFTLSCPAGRSR